LNPSWLLIVSLPTVRHGTDAGMAAAQGQSPSMIAGARWCDPATVGEGARELPVDMPVVVYRDGWI